MGLFSMRERSASETPCRFIRFRIESLTILGSLQVVATVFRSLIPWPSVSSLFNFFTAFDSDQSCNGPGVLPEAHVLETLLRVFMEEVARFSIFATALSARGAIHLAEQISSGLGVDAQALNLITAKAKNAVRDKDNISAF